MSNRLVNLVDQARIGNITAKAILRKIADQSNDAGTGVWSSHEYLAWIIECDPRTVQRLMPFLRDLGVLHWEQRTGNTNLYSVDVDALTKLAMPYKGRIEKMEAVIDRMSEETRQNVGGDTTESRISPYITPKEPTYVNLNDDETPDEMEVELDNFIQGWKVCFPDKQQPRRSSALSKWKTRFRNESFRSNWRRALWQTKDLMWAHNEGWFKWQWFLHNDVNFEKLLDGTFDFKNKPLTGQKADGMIVDDRQGSYDPNWRINLKQRPGESDEDYQKRIGG